MKKVLCLILTAVCMFTFCACSAQNMEGSEVSGKVRSYDCDAQVLLIRVSSGDQYGLVIGPETTITWENTEFFDKNGLPVPSATDFEALNGKYYYSFTIHVTLGEEAPEVFHDFIEKPDVYSYIGFADANYHVDEIVVKAISDNLKEIPEGVLDATEAKPVIYLYPETKTDVSVKLNYDGKLTCTYPAYENGWSVTAAPDGTLTDAKGQTYNYLYWEGQADAEFDFTEGFCVPGEDTAAFLENALAKLGLNRREANEFIVYWLPLMEGNAYNLISFQTEAYTDHAELEISPAPDTLIRVFMAWKPLEEAVEIPAQALTAPERTGFTAVEWGGSQID